MAEISEEASQKYRIPVIERMVDVFALLERTPEGATIREVVKAVKLSRTTVYRMLNTLSAHDFVHRSPAGTYTLGRRLLTLAAHVAPNVASYDLLAIAQPHLNQMSDVTGEGGKLTVLSGDEILVVAASQGRGQYALTATAGQRLPIHAGAAGKVLLAFSPQEDIDRRLSKLDPLTNQTISDPARMLEELALLRERDWARDTGEQMVGVHAFAAPVRDASNAVIAAVSIPFVAGVDERRIEEIRRTVIATARAISRDVAEASKDEPIADIPLIAEPSANKHSSVAKRSNAAAAKGRVGRVKA
ncbi:DNA-binding IclR family transcriptional regulator [Rhizobium sp. BK313]|jgi:DNA-binding IclR family transcriptional regulator|uniref:IclR family transcriptional regulator n=1 Tax=Rhizobium sp. BK313 TaxID=2587081 RepID=UPI0010D6E5B5|nr:IclR family transcriptional regulator [Rhizobium sp. BK313]MBB3457618.1 DNA-binding IclR family transcriptional regulator [Rhizobium sp. BK313]